MNFKWISSNYFFINILHSRKLIWALQPEIKAKFVQFVTILNWFLLLFI